MKKILPFIIIFLAGCQTSGNPIDPYEDYNRQMFAFNEQADEYIITPAVNTYRAIVPPPFRQGVNNFYGNIAEFSYAVNFGLQGKWQDCYHSSIRLVVNSLFGVGGVFEMAEDLGLPRKKNDFGRTLYEMGYTETTYTVSPFFGPSTARDTLGFMVDKVILNPFSHTGTTEIKAGTFLLNYLETKSNITEYLQNITDMPFIEDRYVFIRDTFLQYRQYQLDEGKVNWDNFYAEDDSFEEDDFLYDDN